MLFLTGLLVMVSDWMANFSVLKSRTDWRLHKAGRNSFTLPSPRILRCGSFLREYQFLVTFLLWCVVWAFEMLHIEIGLLVLETTEWSVYKTRFVFGGGVQWIAMQSVTPWTPGEYSTLLHDDCHHERTRSSEIFIERTVFIVAVTSSKNGASGCVLFDDMDSLIDGKECEQKWKEANKCEKSRKKDKERKKRKRKHGDEAENEIEDRKGKDPCDVERRSRKKKEKRKKNYWHVECVREDWHDLHLREDGRVSLKIERQGDTNVSLCKSFYEAVGVEFGIFPRRESQQREGVN